jgi:glutamate formiminotransferase/formiminotetrahydrofolate cyclodeaminase
LHPTAGAVVVGARKPLIAYNVNLNTSDVDIAKRIAKKIRFSSGGLPYVKAMAVDLRARNFAQVSTNLTDFEQTPVHRVFEMVKQEAKVHAVAIASCEIVGLIPRRAIEMTTEFYLQLENFSPAQVLENRIESTIGIPTRDSESGSNSISPAMGLNEIKSHDASAPFPTVTNVAALAEPLLAAITAPGSTPAAGSATAIAAALAAALGEKVAGISRKKKSLAVYAERLGQESTEFHAASKPLAEAAIRDAAAPTAVIAAHDLPEETSGERLHRDAAMQEALTSAIEVALDVARRAADIFQRLGQLESICGSSMLADVRVGRLMAASAVRGALENITINLASITDTDFAARVRSESAALASHLMENRVAASC